MSIQRVIGRAFWEHLETEVDVTLLKSEILATTGFDVAHYLDNNLFFFGYREEQSGRLKVRWDADFHNILSLRYTSSYRVLMSRHTESGRSFWQQHAADVARVMVDFIIPGHSIHKEDIVNAFVHANHH